jgi:hypothetical protein
MQGNFRILGFVLGCLHDDGFSREQIDWAVREILDGIEKVKRDPALLAELEGTLQKIGDARNAPAQR